MNLLRKIPKWKILAWVVLPFIIWFIGLSEARTVTEGAGFFFLFMIFLLMVNITENLEAVVDERHKRGSPDTRKTGRRKDG